MKKESKGIEGKPGLETPMVIDEMMIPIKNPTVTVREEMEEDGKYILYNADNELILVMNPTGKFIMEGCDGKKTVAQMIGDIENHFTVQDDIDLSAVVKGYISTLLKAKLVTIKGEEK